MSAIRLTANSDKLATLTNTLELDLPTVTVPVKVVPTTEDRPYRLSIPVPDIDVQIPWQFQGAIVWKLSSDELPEGVASIQFDQPAISFISDPPDMLPMCTTDRQSLVMPWTNLDPDVPNIRPYGMSFYYQLHVKVTTTSGMVLSVSHDPTVHNETPNP